MGLQANAVPLFHVKPLPWQPIDRSEVDALLLGSANALRHAGQDLAQYKGLPAYAVGETTAKAAEDAGLEVVGLGHGGLQNVLSALDPTHTRLLRLAGQERVELSIPHGITVHTREVYASLPYLLESALALSLQNHLEAPTVVLLHSGEAAARFEHLCTELKINRAHVFLGTIGPRVSARAGKGWGAVFHAEKSCDTALLALAERMCQDCRLDP